MQSNKNTNIILGILAVIVLVVVFVYTRGAGSQTVSSGLTAENANSSNEISSFLRRISAIKDVKLDSTVFDNPVLKNGLNIDAQELVPEDKGRTDPFSPVNGMGASVGSISSNTNIQQAPVSVPVPVPVQVAPKKVLSD